jgi:hypothetical protein
VDYIRRKDKYYCHRQLVPELLLFAVLLPREIDATPPANVDSVIAIIAVVVLVFIDEQTNKARI